MRRSFGTSGEAQQRLNSASLILTLVLIGTSCTPTAPTSPTPTTAVPTTAVPAEPAVPTETVVVALGSFEREGLDPGLTTNATMGYYGSMYDFFILSNANGEPSKDLGALRDWQMSDDGKTWTLTLREGMQWHDGEKVTSVDATFSFERYASSDAGCAMCGALQTDLESVEIVDDLTFRVHLKAPNPFLPSALIPLQGDMPILPKHHWDKVGGSPGFQENPLGSGPFKFVSRQIGEYIEFEANTEYWNREAIPGFKTLRIILVPEESTRLATVRRGDADLAYMSSQSAAEIQSAGLRIMGPKNTWVSYLQFSQSWDPAFATNRVEVRKAMALAIDRQALAEALYPPGTAEVADFLVSPLQEGYDPSLEPYPFDPEEARRLLQGARAEELEVTMYQFQCCGFGEWLLTSEAAAGYLEAVGFRPNVIPRDFASFADQFQAGELDGPAHLMPFAWLTSSTLDNNLRVLMLGFDDGGQFPGFWDAEGLGELYHQYTETLAIERRQEIALDINHLMHDSYGYIPIAVKNETWAVGPRIGSWQPIAGSPLYHNFQTLRP